MPTQLDMPVRRYPAIDARKRRAFALFDRGDSTARVANRLSISIRTAQLYRAEWKRQQAMQADA